MSDDFDSGDFDSDESTFAEVGHFDTVDEVMSNVRTGIFRANICRAFGLEPGVHDRDECEDDGGDPETIGGKAWEIRTCAAGETREGMFCVRVLVGIGAAGSNAAGWRDYAPEGAGEGGAPAQLHSQSSFCGSEDEGEVALRERERQTLRNTIKAGITRSETRFGEPCEVQTYESVSASVALDVENLVADHDLQAYCVDRGEAFGALRESSFRADIALEKLRRLYIDGDGASECDEPPTDIDASDNTFECTICLEDVAFDAANVLQARALGRSGGGQCGHLFCDACWGGALLDARTRKELLLDFGCMQAGCARRVTRDELAYIAEAHAALESVSLLNALDEWTVDDKVSKDACAAYCPTAGCRCVLRVDGVAKGARRAAGVAASGGAAASGAPLGGRTTPATRGPESDAAKSAFGGVVCTTCFNGICWLCGKDAHEPCVCAEVEEWTAKTGTESELWLRKLMAGVKQCPKCGQGCAIDAKVACNHMTCNCGHEWCWMCLQPYRGHGDTYYTCSKFDKDKALAEETERDAGLVDIRRMEHYTDLTHMQEKGTSAEARADMDSAVAALAKCADTVLGKTPMQLAFLNGAKEATMRARLGLKWSYALLYFVDEEDPGRRRVGEAQSKSQRVLERLETMVKCCRRGGQELSITAADALVSTLKCAGATICGDFTAEATRVEAATRKEAVARSSADTAVAVCDALFNFFAVTVRSLSDELETCLRDTLFQARRYLAVDGSGSSVGRRVWQYSRGASLLEKMKKRAKKSDGADVGSVVWVDFADELQAQLDEKYVAFSGARDAGVATTATATLTHGRSVIWVDFSSMVETIDGGKQHALRYRTVSASTLAGAVNKFGSKECVCPPPPSLCAFAPPNSVLKPSLYRFKCSPPTTSRLVSRPPLASRVLSHAHAGLISPAERDARHANTCSQQARAMRASGAERWVSSRTVVDDTSRLRAVA
jgi:hypothetical protein